MSRCDDGDPRLQCDHVVALKNAWISGGPKLSPKQRQAFANDPLNLMASAASANRSKGDRKSAGKTSSTARKPAPKRATKTTTRKVHPGAFCSPRGAQGVGGSKGKAYTCKTSKTDIRARWRR